MSFIPKEQIDFIQATVPIEDVIRATGHHIKGSGRSRGIEQCPNCGRDYTHIKINTSKNLFNCFSPSCGFRGNQFHWVMKAEGLSFPEAAKRVAAIGGIEIEQDDEVIRMNEQKQKAFRLALEFYESQDHPYLLHERKILPEVAKQFRSGYAPGGVALKKHLNKQGLTNEFLLEIGLLRTVAGNKLMDRFYKSIVIPDIRSGRILDFYGRSVDPSINTKHMYLDGSRSFIGWHMVKPGQKVFIVEAPIDGMSAYQITGIPAVSIGGAGKFENWHIYYLKSQNIKPILALDNDEAGIVATIEIIDMLEEHGIESEVLIINDAKDVNKLLEYGVSKSDLLDHIVDSKEFKWRYQLSQMPQQFIEKYLREKAV